MIIAVCGQKGGTGKTTIATALSVEYCARGRRVLLIDLDPQRTVLTWAAQAKELKEAHVPAVAALRADLRRELRARAGSYDVAVLDCPPGDGELQRAALMVSDVALLPCIAAAFEVWALTASVKLVKEAQAVRSALRAAVVINRMQAHTTAGREAREVLQQFELPVLAAELGQRVVYSRAPRFGQGPTTHAPRSLAADEVRALATEIEGLVATAPVRQGEE